MHQSFNPQDPDPTPTASGFTLPWRVFHKWSFFKTRKKHKNHRVSSLEISRPLEIAKCSSFNVKQTQRRPSVTNPIGWTALKRPELQLGMERQRAVWVRNPSEIFPNWISVNKKTANKSCGWMGGVDPCVSELLFTKYYYETVSPYGVISLFFLLEYITQVVPSCIAFHFNWTNGQSVAACHVIYRLL